MRLIGRFFGSRATKPAAHVGQLSLLLLVVEASPSGIALVNGEGRVVLVNAETERLFG